MIKLLANYPYIQWLLWSIWIPVLVIWAFFFRILKNYPKTIIKVILGCLAFGITWDYFAIKTNIWYYPNGCCINQRVWGLPIEEFAWVVSAAVLISSVTIVTYYITRRKNYKR